MTPDERDLADFVKILSALPADLARRILADPAYSPRCSCGEFWCAGWIVDDWSARHAASVCQPWREVLDDPVPAPYMGHD